MCRSTIEDLRYEHIRAEGTSYTTHPMTPWKLLFGTDTLRLVEQVRTLQGNYRQKLRFQTADVRTDRPNDWTDLSTANVRSTEGAWIQDEDVSGTTTALWVRAGIAASASSAAGESLAGMSMAMDASGTVVGTLETSIQPSTNDTQSAVFPVGPAFPALNLTGLMGGMIIMGESGNFQWRLAWRAIATDRQEPSAWTSLGSFNTPSSANESVNTGTHTIAPGVNQYAQVGLEVQGTSGRVNVRLVVAAKY